MDCIVDNVPDIVKYYNKSYIKLAEYGDKLFFVQEIDHSAISLTDKEGNAYQISLHNNVPYKIDLLFPHKSLYQMDEWCYSLTRIPARQFHRGITSNNCSIKVLTTDGWETVSLNWNTLDGYVNKPDFKPLETALQQTGSQALSPIFAVVYNEFSKVFDLYCHTKLVGNVNKKTRSFNIHPLLLPEFTTLLAATGMLHVYKQAVLS